MSSKTRRLYTCLRDAYATDRRSSLDSVVRRARGSLLQLFDFVFDQEFLSLEFMHFQIVRRRLRRFLGDGLFNGLMATHEFRQMRFDRHGELPVGFQRRNCDTRARARKVGKLLELDQKLPRTIKICLKNSRCGRSLRTVADTRIVERRAPASSDVGRCTARGHGAAGRIEQRRTSSDLAPYRAPARRTSGP